MKKIFILFILIFSFFSMSLSVAFCAETLTTTYSEKNKFGLIRGDKKITEAKYSKLIRLKDSSYLCLYKNKYGIISNDGEILVEPKYTQAQRLAGRFAKLGRAGKYGIFDENANLIIGVEYSSIELLYGKMFLVEKNFKYGLINFDGDILLAPVADDIYMPKPNVLKISFNNNWYEIEQKGKQEFELPYDIEELDKNFKVTQIIQNPVISTGYGVVSASDYLIKLFSSISPAYEKTIDELILGYGADTANILIKSGWLIKFPFVYSKNYINNLIAPNNGPLSDVKADLKNKLK